jgi:hypothetical protein
MSYFMVDIEADGPIPGDFSMVSLGAVIVEPGLSRTFYGRFKPISDDFIPDALKVSGHSREETLKGRAPVVDRPDGPKVFHREVERETFATSTAESPIVEEPGRVLVLNSCLRLGPQARQGSQAPIHHLLTVSTLTSGMSKGT